MATSIEFTPAEVPVLGVFEDRPQQEFLVALLSRAAARQGLPIRIEARRTHGCHWAVLQEHLRHAPGFRGIVVGVDSGRRLDAAQKEEVLKEKSAPFLSPGIPVLWSVAWPSIEEWLMADAEALPLVLARRFGPANVNEARRPAVSRSEVVTKRSLRDWCRTMVGRRLLRDGTEYATDVGRALAPTNVSATRNPELTSLLGEQLPTFLAACRAAP